MRFLLSVSSEVSAMKSISRQILKQLARTLKHRCNTLRRTRVRKYDIQSLESRLLLFVTTTYGFDFDQNTDLTQGPTESQPDATSLVNGGFAVSGTHNGHTDVDIFDADLSDAGGANIITGTNSAIDQLDNGNLVVTTQDSDSIRFTVLDGSGFTVVPETDLGDTSSTLPDVAALRFGGFVIVNQDAFTAPDFDIDVIIRNNAGGAVNSFAIDSSGATDNAPKVAALDDGGFAVAWTRTVGVNTQFWYAVYEANGSVRRPSQLLDNTGTVNRNVDISPIPNGFVVVYEDNGWGTGTNDITLAKFTNAGVFQGYSNISNPSQTNDASNDANPTVTTLTNGLVVVGWEDNLFGDTDAYIELYDPITNQGLASRRILGGGGNLDDEADITIAGSANGRINVFQTNLTLNDVVGETVFGRRTSTSDGADDLIDGDDFIDIMNGGGGSDTLNGFGGDDIIIGDAGNDNIDGGDGDDVLVGGANNDTLRGYRGSDTLSGGLNDDTYFFGSATPGEVDILTELVGEGTDTLDFDFVFTPVTANLGLVTPQAVHTDRSITLNLNNTFENLIGGEAADSLTGNTLNNVITGRGDNDTLNGFTGSDTLAGGLDNDSYTFGFSSPGEVDSLIEAVGEGTDTLNFAGISTQVIANLGALGAQPVHTNRSISLNLNNTFENLAGG